MLVNIIVGIAIVLAFVIWGLGAALVTLSRRVVEKNKSSAKKIITSLLLVYDGVSPTTLNLLLAVIGIEVILILVLAFSIKGMAAALLPEKKVVPADQKVSVFQKWWAILDKKLTKAVPVEREADVMLDHDYDGIKELDNALPPWWKYGFYLTIIVAVVYMFNFHVFGTGKNPAEEYAAEMQQAKEDKEQYEANNKDKIDEKNVPMANADGLTAAKEIFNTKCFACHGKAGEGGAGPNLTDDYWLHNGSLNDIYNTIKVGYPDKGMQSWAGVFSPKEISYLASYIKTLNGTKPANAKAPQGEIWKP